MRKLVVTPPWVTETVSPLVKLGAAGVVEKVKITPGWVGPVFRFAAGVVGRFAE